jgi:hypothetical protein
MKRLSLILALLLCFTLCPVARADGETPAPEVFTSGDYEYILLEDGTAEITKYRGKESNLVIPGALDGFHVTCIGYIAFYKRSSLTSVIIPDSVTIIGEAAFYRCPNLANVTIPDSVVTIGQLAFSDCPKLTSFNVSMAHPAFAVVDGVLFEKASKKLICYPKGKSGTSYDIPQGIQSVGASAFSSCQNLTSITIPDSVTTIEDFAFEKCEGLTAITIPDSVISVGNNPFNSCENLIFINVSPDHPTLAVIEKVLFEKTAKRLVCYPSSKVETSYAIPQGIQQIDDCAFCRCTNLTDIIIPDSVMTIGYSAFYGCIFLTKLVIPFNVTSIDKLTFYGCYSLTSVTIPDSVTFIGENAFAKCPNLTVTVGRGSYAAQYCHDNGIPYTYPDSLDWLNN